MAEVALPSLRALLEADSLAVVGAVPAGEIARLASAPLRYLGAYGYKGRVYAVNPQYSEVDGIPCAPSVTELPEPVDVVMILRRPDAVAAVMSEAGKSGVKAAVVCTGGFAETGAAGKAAQDELAKIAAEHEMLLCGPNTDGILNVPRGMMLGFHPVLERPQLVGPGSVAIVAHSGSVAGSIMARLGRAEVGLSSVVTCGNEAQLCAADYLSFLGEDVATKTIILFVEGIRGGESFLAACVKAREAGKRVLALKVGRSKQAERLAAGHTGAVVGSFTAFVAAMRDVGVLVASSIEELVDAVQLGDSDKTVVGLSMSGGISALMADLAGPRGIRFVNLDPAQAARLRELVPISNPMNPFDVTGVAVDRPEVLGQVLDVLQGARQGGEVIFGLGLLPERTAAAWAVQMRDFVGRSKAHILGYAAAGAEVREVYGHFASVPGVSVFGSLGVLFDALAAQRGAGSGRRRLEIAPRPRTPVETVRTEPANELRRRRALLASAGIDYVPFYIGTRPELPGAAKALGYPVCLKVVSLEVRHKAALGLVALDLRDEQELVSAIDQLGMAAQRAGLVTSVELTLFEVQQMLPRRALELILGVSTDETFGPVVTVGLGGRFVEAYADVGSALAPCDSEQAVQLLTDLKVGRSGLLSDGEVASVAQRVSSFSELVAGSPENWSEVEINPLLVFDGNCIAVDDLWIRGQDDNEEGER